MNNHIHFIDSNGDELNILEQLDQRVPLKADVDGLTLLTKLLVNVAN